VDISILEIYDEELAEYGEYIVKRRIEYIKELNDKGREIHKEITSEKENIQFEYMTNVKNMDIIKDELLSLLIKNREKAEKLHGEYKSFYFDTRKYLKSEVRQGTEMQNALSDLLDILLDGMETNRPLNEIIPQRDSFIEEFTAALPKYTPSEKLKHRREKKIWAGAISALVIICVLWKTGYTPLWVIDIGYFSSNADYELHTETDTRSYSIDIDLNDTKRSIGYTIYLPQGCTAEIHDIQKCTDNYYMVWFRSHGKYSLKSAVLVSGMKQSATKDGYSSSYFGKMTTEYNGKVYNGEMCGGSGLNYKDGDDFGFYMISQGGDNDFTDFKGPSGKVRITISNLCINTWTRK
jgi:hypothetical protein